MYLWEGSLSSENHFEHICKKLFIGCEFYIYLHSFDKIYFINLIFTYFLLICYGDKFYNKTKKLLLTTKIKGRETTTTKTSQWWRRK